MWRHVPVVHLEAGLRSGDLEAPFPEEANRRMLTVFADLHLAPTPRAMDALEADGVDRDRAVLVGNTAVDAALTVAERARRRLDGAAQELVELCERADRGAVRLMLVTAHRRESWGAPLDRILIAVRQILDANPDVHAVVPAHPNPTVRDHVTKALRDEGRALVMAPLPYTQLCAVLARAQLVLSDSGGIQEEAPSFRVPVLVLRDVTERMEAVDGGWAELVGTDTARIVASAKRILGGGGGMPTTGNPFGDGRSAERSAQAIAWLLDQSPRPTEFQPPVPG